MGWRFRRSLRLGPVRVNLSTRGVGASFGWRVFRVGVRPDGGRYLTISIPGTGLSWSMMLPRSGIDMQARQTGASVQSAIAQSPAASGRARHALALSAAGGVGGTISEERQPQSQPSPDPRAIPWWRQRGIRE